MRKVAGLLVLVMILAALAMPAVFADGVSEISLYKRNGDRTAYERWGDTYVSEWTAGNDITSIFPIASKTNEIAINGRHYQDVWKEAWNSFSGSEGCKICYRVEFGTSDGNAFDVMIKKPGDELVYKEYLENYIYDDIRVAKGEWYSHLEPGETGDLTLSSMKITAGKKIDYINTPVKITACVCKGEDDFDGDGFYKGDVSASLTLKRKALSLGVSVARNDKAASYTRDNDYYTDETVNPGDRFTVRSSTPMAGVYVMWNSPVKEWKISFGDKEISRPAGGFIHDYIEVGGVTECTITVSEKMLISEIRAYSEGELPADIQLWDKPLDGEADMLVFSTHADDEVLFFGGAVTLYNALGYKVQVVYMCDYWDGEKSREHEKLDGLWTMGLRNYPASMAFSDHYADSLEAARSIYDYNKLVSAVAANIRRFKPLVIVTHDIDGEYGHGGHMILCAALREAVEKTADETFEPDSAEKYGVYDTPKTYLHLYKENALRLDLRQKMDALGGKTPLEVEKESYKRHVTQQWTWFYVDDEYRYSCAAFGLYRTTVGLDTAGATNMMENVVSYAEQKRIEEEERLKREEEERLKEEERLRQEEEERLKKEEEERLRKEEEERLRREEEERKLAEKTPAPTNGPKTNEEESGSPKNSGGPLYFILGVLMLSVAVILSVFVLYPAFRKILKSVKKDK